MADVVTASKALTATVVAICTSERIADTSEALGALREHSGVRTILICLGRNPQPPLKTEHDVVTIDDLAPHYLNNAVAYLRLSSLPSMAWWRGGDIAYLPALAELVDRLVLDAADPRDGWAAVPHIAGRTMISDLRWTRLTRWRSLMAQFFDVPDIRQSIGSFTTLRIAGGDPYAQRLYGGWITARLPEGKALAIEIESNAHAAPIQSVRLSGSRYTLTLAVEGTRACIHTSVELDGRAVVSRIVPLGDQSTDALIAEELRVRARDVAFEEALERSGASSEVRAPG